MTLFLGITASTITGYINIAFYILIGLIALGFLNGIVKGFWKQLFSCLYYAGLLLLLIFNLTKLTNYVCGIDLNVLLNKVGLNLPSELEGLRTISEIVQHYIIELIKSIDQSLVLDENLMAEINSITIMVVRVLVFLLGNVLISLLGIILCPLLYHLIFKWFIPRKVRKKVKLRILGGVTGAIQWIVVGSLFISPLTSIANSIVNVTKDENGNVKHNQSNDDTYYQNIYNVLEGYNNSLFTKYLFSFKINGKSFDLALMEKILKDDKYNNFDLYGELGQYASVFYEAMNEGIYNLSTNTINYVNLLESTFIKDCLYSLSTSSFLQIVLPIALTIALNSFKADLNADLSHLSFINIDWENSLKAIGDAFESIRQSDVLKDFDKDTNFLDAIIIDEEHLPYYQNALQEIGDSSLIKTLLPQIICTYLDSNRKDESNSQVSYLSEENTNNKNKFEFDLPEEAYQIETYQNISWGDELSNMISIYADIAASLHARTNKTISLGNMVSLLSDKDTLIGTLLGYDSTMTFESEEDFDNNVYLNGGEVTLEDGSSITLKGLKGILGLKDDQYGLLNLNISKILFDDLSVIPQILTQQFVQDMLPDQYKDLKDIIDSSAEKMKEWNIQEWKNEFYAISDCIVPLLNVANIINENKEGEIKDTLKTLSSGSSKVSLNYFSNSMEGSQLMSDIAPKMFEKVCKNNDQELMLGIKMSDFNFTSFENSTFANEIKYLINDVLPSITDVMDIDFSSGIEEIVANDEVLDKALNSLYKSQIFNRVLSEEEITQGKISTFQNIMINLLVKPSEEEISQGKDTSMNLPTITDGMIESDKDVILGIKKWDGEDGEIHHLCSSIGSLKKPDESSTQYILDFISGKKIDLENDIYSMGDELERIFISIDQSIIMKKCISHTFNNMIKDNNNDLLSSIDFSNVDSWSSEGEALKLTLNSINELRKNSSSDIVSTILNCDKKLLKEYQYNNLSSYSDLDEDQVNLANIYLKANKSYSDYFKNESKTYDLLNKINSTKSINLSSLLYETIKTALTNENKKDQLLSDEQIIQMKDDFNFEDVIYENSIYVTWEYNDNILNYNGEIYNISRLITFANDVNDISTLDNNSFSELTKVINETYPLHSSFGELISNSLNKISFGDNFNDIFNENYIDFDYISEQTIGKNSITTRKKEINIRQEELNNISIIYSLKDKISNFDSVNFEATINNLTSREENETESDFEKLLNSLHDSNMFNAKKIISSRDDENYFLTFFEKIFVKLFELDSNNLIQSPTVDDYKKFNNKNENDLWKNEITSLNEALNEYANNQITSLLSSSNDMISEISSCLKNNPKELSNLFVKLHYSKLLDKSLPKIVDEKIVSNINKEIICEGINTIDNPYQSIYKLEDNAIKELLNIKIGNISSDVKESFWEYEGDNFKDIIINVSNVDFSNTKNLDSAKVDNIISSIQNSIALNINDAGNEQTFNTYHTIIIKIINLINESLENNLSLDVTNSNYKKIIDFDNEKDNLISFFDIYNNIDGKFDLSNGINIPDEKNEREELVDSLQELLNVFYKSDVYHYLKNYDRESENTYSIFEQLVKKLISSSSLGKKLDVNQEIKDITESDIGNKELIWFENENGEINKLCDLVKDGSNFDTSNNDISNYLSKDENNNYSGLIPSVNNSYLLHPLVVSTFKEYLGKGYGEISFNNLFFITSKDNKYYFDKDNTTDKIEKNDEFKFSDKVNAWNEEYYLFINIFNKISKIDSSNTNFKYLENKQIFETILTNLN